MKKSQVGNTEKWRAPGSLRKHVFQQGKNQGFGWLSNLKPIRRSLPHGSCPQEQLENELMYSHHIDSQRLLNHGWVRIVNNAWSMTNNAWKMLGWWHHKPDDLLKHSTNWQAIPVHGRNLPPKFNSWQLIGATLCSWPKTNCQCPVAPRRRD